jgi:hypothetical protein
MIQPVLLSDESFGSDLTVFHHAERQSLEVYFGVTLLERIPEDPKVLQHKMFIGRLYNAGVPVTLIREKFHHDPRSIKRWGAGLLCTDLEDFASYFAGRGHHGKVTDEIRRYAQQLYSQKEMLGRNYRQGIINNISDVFGVTLSPATVSEIIHDKSQHIHLENNTLSADELLAYARQKEPILSSNKNGSVGDTPTLPFLQESFCLSKGGGGGANWSFIQHAGLTLFASTLGLFNGFLRQLLCQLLAGACNIEQSKAVCIESLEFFCENTLNSPALQRSELDRLGQNPQLLMDIYRLNNELLLDGPNNGELFYFDPHTKEYTGELKVLKGWCGRKHGISKVLNLDCFHTRSGRACYIQHHSPYYDMRRRFFMNLTNFNQLFAEEKRQNRTFVIDRAIFGLDVFRMFKNDWLITWEKGYKRDGWDASGKSLSTTFTRYRYKNHRKSRKKYTFHCQEGVWEKERSWRRLIVRAENDLGKSLEVSILTNNPHMDVRDVVWAIFNRWLQENDFKYLDEKYGINELDSRARSKFKTVAASFDDLDVDCPEYRELKKQLQDKETQLGKALVTDRKLERTLELAEIERLKLIALGEKKINDLRTGKRSDKLSASAEMINRIDVFLKKKARQQEQSQSTKQKIEEIEKEAHELSIRLDEAMRKQSKLLLLVNNDFSLLETKRKALMDAMRVCASNIFASVHAQFRATMNNYRDDHVKLRMLTKASGIVQKQAEHYVIKLWVCGKLQKNIRIKMQQFLDSIAEQINLNRDKKIKISFQIISGTIKNMGV